MTIVTWILLVCLLAALIRIPIPSAGRADVFLYLVVIVILLFVLLTDRVHAVSWSASMDRTVVSLRGPEE